MHFRIPALINVTCLHSLSAREAAPEMRRIVIQDKNRTSEQLPHEAGLRQCTDCIVRKSQLYEYGEDRPVCFPSLKSFKLTN